MRLTKVLTLCALSAAVLGQGNHTVHTQTSQNVTETRREPKVVRLVKRLISGNVEQKKDSVFDVVFRPFGDDGLDQNTCFHLSEEVHRRCSKKMRPMDQEVCWSIFIDVVVHCDRWPTWTH